MRLANPWFLLLLLFVPLLVRWYLRGRAAPPTLKYSDLRIVDGARPTSRVQAVWIPWALRILTILLLTVAVARPQYGVNRDEVISKGIDIIMILDNSGSMLSIDPYGSKSIDPEHTRLNVAKEVISDFVTRRRNDRIGLITFAGKAYYQCPLTLDYGILLTFLDSITINEKYPQTAIGDALGTAVLHLKDSNAESKVAVLVTDGENNEGILSPLAAAQAAEQFEVKVYTVGVGSPTGAVRMVEDFFGKHYVPVRSGLDEATLEKIAEITGAKYFHAGNPEAMKKVFRKIDAMEKTEVKMNRYTEYSERFTPWAIWALILLGLEVMLVAGPLRTMP